MSSLNGNKSVAGHKYLDQAFFSCWKELIKFELKKNQSVKPAKSVNRNIMICNTVIQMFFHEDEFKTFREDGIFNYSTMLLRDNLGLLLLGAREAIYALDINDISVKKAVVRTFSLFWVIWVFIFGYLFYSATSVLPNHLYTFVSFKIPSLIDTVFIYMRR